jgi:HAD superfamily hydrolase (TIGR01509 family)
VGAPSGTVRACLVDVYETLVAYDFESHTRQLAALAGADVADWRRAQIAMEPRWDSGGLPMNDAVAQILAECGLAASPEEADPDLVESLVRADADWMRAGCVPYPDAVPFLRGLRDRGLLIALVSNCAEDTRPMLDRLELTGLADAAILSCEVGTPKPAPEIYQRALDALGVPAVEAVMIDDQPRYCAGAEAVGVRAIQIARDGTAGDPRFTPVPALLDIPPLL